MRKKLVSGEDTKSDFGLGIRNTQVKELSNHPDTGVWNSREIPVGGGHLYHEFTARLPGSRVKECQILFIFTSRRRDLISAYLGSSPE